MNQREHSPHEDERDPDLYLNEPEALRRRFGALPPQQRVEVIERHGVRLQVTSLVLRELPAEMLLSDARTVCFAAGADAAGRAGHKPLVTLP